MAALRLPRSNDVRQHTCLRRLAPTRDHYRRRMTRSHVGSSPSSSCCSESCSNFGTAHLRRPARCSAWRSTASTRCPAPRCELARPAGAGRSALPVQHTRECPPIGATRPQSGGSDAGDLVAYFSVTLARRDTPRATLAEEARLVDAYLRIHRIRMGSRLAYEIDVPASLARVQIPSMMLLTSSKTQSNTA